MRKLGWCTVVKAFVRGDLEQKRFGIANDEYRSTATYASRVVALMMPLIMLIMNLSSVAVIWFGGLQVNAGNASRSSCCH